MSQIVAFEEILSTAGDLGASLFSGILTALMAIRKRKGKTITPGGISLAATTPLFYTAGLL
ncbi:hypothetical protein [Pyrobaculum sp.]|uniref:hypothetical protein n=1 Tax=Pyrobaculum sp. TaxID=2004705 RepID=UPI003168CDC2